MLRRHVSALAIAGTLLLPAGVATACDAEDRADLEEVERDAEDLGEKIENEIDKADTDGKDD